MPYLFVYGSLKRGFKQHDRHMKGARFLAATRTREAAYTLLAVLDPDATDHYPTLALGGACHIQGEVYEIGEDTLKMLDEYEGENYRRITVPLESGQEAIAYLYEGADIETQAVHPRIRINGDTAEWIVG
jgi:gamma-glutamylaminecyclotransferase